MKRVKLIKANVVTIANAPDYFLDHLDVFEGATEVGGVPDAWKWRDHYRLAGTDSDGVLEYEFHHRDER